MINGVNLTGVETGQVIDITPRDAGILLSEGWALPMEVEPAESRNVVRMPTSEQRAEAADRNSKAGTKSA